MRRMLACSAAMAFFCAVQAQAGAPGRYASLVKEYFDGTWRASPSTATSTGLHDWDSQLDDVSAAAHARETARLSSVMTRLRGLDVMKLSASDRNDRDILVAEIDRQLLEQQTIQGWRHNPGSYVDLLTSAIYSLIERDFAPLPDRMRSVIARENLVPGLLAEARKNLTDMPPVFIDIALENLAGATGFFSKDVPEAFATITDPVLRKQLAESTKAILAALVEYTSFLAAQKPTSHGSFVLGRDVLRHLLATDMINVPVDRIMKVGRAQLAKDHDAFLATEKLVDPKTPDAALAVLEKDHPDGAHLVSTARDQLKSLQSYIEQHKILDLPSQMLPVVAETPAFARATIFGELDPPGPLETHATKAYYFITPPDPKEPMAAQDKYLGYFNRALLQNLSVHEALPGHFTQYLFATANPAWSMVRKTAGSYTATEGWAHYSEQMMLDEGLGNGDPKLRLAQLQDALLRDCRLVDSIGMHTGKMTLAQATDLMRNECFQPESVAYKEARRGTSDPGYYSYTLGKLEILKLRGDAQAAQGKAFTLAKFHDAFLGAGLVPIAVIRREILGKDGPVL
jgi:uncharacterized protein (DUF885 family)